MAEDIPRNPSPEQLDAMNQWQQDVGNAAADKLHNDLKFVNTLFGGAPKEAANAIGQGLADAGKGLEDMGQGFTQGLSDFGSGIVQGVTDFGNGVGEFFSGVADRANKTFSVLTTGQLPDGEQEVTEMGDKNTLMDTVMAKVNEMTGQLNVGATTEVTIEDDATPMAASPDANEEVAKVEDPTRTQNWSTAQPERETKKQKSAPETPSSTPSQPSSGGSSSSSSSKSSSSSASKGSGSSNGYYNTENGTHYPGEEVKVPASYSFGFKNMSKNIDVSKIAEECRNLELTENPASTNQFSDEGRVKATQVDFDTKGRDMGMSYMA